MNKFHLLPLLKKNYLNFTRNKVLLFLNIITPILLLALYAGVNYFDDADITQISVINQDMVGVNNPRYNYSARVSYEFTDILEGLSMGEETNDKKRFEMVSKIGNERLTLESGIEWFDQGKIDALVIIPEDFSENIIGNTWWYYSIKTYNVTSLNDLGDNFQNYSVFYDYFLEDIQQTDFPVDGTPTVQILIKQNDISNLFIPTIIDQIIDGLVFGYNSLNDAQTMPVIVYNNQFLENDLSLSGVDMFFPRFIMMLGLTPIISVSTVLITEKEEKTLELIETTRTSYPAHILSIFLTQLTLYLPQNALVALIVPILGPFVHQYANMWYLFLNLTATTIFSCAFGILLGMATKSINETVISSFSIIMFLIFFSGSFFSMNKTLLYFIPTYYANYNASRIIFEGNTNPIIVINIGILMIYGLLTVLLTLIYAKYKKRV